MLELALDKLIAPATSATQGVLFPAEIVRECKEVNELDVYPINLEDDVIYLKY